MHEEGTQGALAIEKWKVRQVIINNDTITLTLFSDDHMATDRFYFTHKERDCFKTFYSPNILFFRIFNIRTLNDRQGSYFNQKTTYFSIKS